MYLGTITLANIFGAIWGPTMLRLLRLESGSHMMVLIWGWFIGNELAGIVLGSLVLKAFSGMIIKKSMHVRRWFA